MKVVVVDHVNARGASLRLAISKLDYKCEHFKNVWGDEDKSPPIWDQSARTLCKSLLVGQPAVFVHRNNDFAEEFARDLCQELYVIFYSGGGLTANSINYLTDGRNKYPKHCVFPREVHDEVSLTDWDLETCLRELSQGRADFCDRLQHFDRELEAKLNLLYACLGGGNGITEFIQTSETSEPYGWNLLKESSIPWKWEDAHPEAQTRLGDILQRLADLLPKDLPKDKLPEFSIDQRNHLVRLRDALLDRD
jgi:hypothetical protein